MRMKTPMGSTLPDRPRDSDLIFQHRPFILFWLSRVCSAVAFQIAAVAVGWQVYALTESPFNLGMVGLVQFLPMVLLTLLAGHVADKYDRRVIVRICQAIEGCALAVLALGSSSQWLHVAGIFAAVGVVGAARSFENPSLAALLPGLIPLRLLPQASALSSSAMQTAFIIGPALGGFLYAAGAEVPYAVASLLFFLACLCSWFIRIEQRPNVAERRGFESLFSGIAFIRSHPVILGAISLDLFAVLLGGATALLPIYARDILHTSAWGLGVLRSAPAAGALVMSLGLARYPMERRVGLVMFTAVMVFGGATVIFALSTSLMVSLLALATLGAADVFSVVIRMTLVQVATPDHMRGRVSAVNTLFIGTSNQLGEFESGVTAALLGVVPAAVLGGVGTILVALVWMRLFPELRDVDNFKTLDG
jgi:MFS family permease